MIRSIHKYPLFLFLVVLVISVLNYFTEENILKRVTEDIIWLVGWPVYLLALWWLVFDGLICRLHGWLVGWFHLVDWFHLAGW